MIVILQMTNDLEPWEPLPSGSKEKNNVVLSQVRCQEYSTTGCIPSDLSNVLQSVILHRQSFNGWVAEMCLRWNRSKGRGKHCNEWSEIILKRTNTSDAYLANAFSDQTDLSLNWCAKLQSYERSPKRCCDSQTHLQITIPTLLSLSWARAERCSQSAAGMSQAESRMCCSGAQLLWSPARRLIPGSNPPLLTGCCGAGRSSKACEYSRQCPSPEQWMPTGNAEQEFVLPPSRVFTANLFRRTLDLIFIIINSRHKRNQTWSSTSNSHTTVFQCISEMTGRFSPDFFFFHTGRSYRYFTGTSIFWNRKFAQKIKVMVRDKSDSITNLLLFSDNYVRVRIVPTDKKIYFLLSSIAWNALLIYPINC